MPLCNAELLCLSPQGNPEIEFCLKEHALQFPAWSPSSPHWLQIGCARMRLAVRLLEAMRRLAGSLLTSHLIGSPFFLASVPSLEKDLITHKLPYLPRFGTRDMARRSFAIQKTHPDQASQQTEKQTTLHTNATATHPLIINWKKTPRSITPKAKQIQNQTNQPKTKAKRTQQTQPNKQSKDKDTTKQPNQRQQQK